VRSGLFRLDEVCGKMEVTAAETPNLHKLFCLRKLTFTIL